MDDSSVNSSEGGYVNVTSADIQSVDKVIKGADQLEEDISTAGNASYGLVDPPPTDSALDGEESHEYSQVSYRESRVGVNKVDSKLDDRYLLNPQTEQKEYLSGSREQLVEEEDYIPMQTLDKRVSHWPLPALPSSNTTRMKECLPTARLRREACLFAAVTILSVVLLLVLCGVIVALVQIQQLDNTVQDLKNTATTSHRLL